jgi:hypothetical protein
LCIQRVFDSWESPKPFYIIFGGDNLRKEQVINIRVTKKEKEELIKLSEKAGMSLSMYLIEQGLDKDIIIIEGIEKFEAELRKIGNNINQLTRWANYGYLKVVSLDEVKKELGKIWNELLDVFNYYKY